jgi:DNA-binding CsgD family transcriptional regulator
MHRSDIAPKAQAHKPERAAMIAMAALRPRPITSIPDYDLQDDGVTLASASIGSAVIEALNRLEYGILLVDGDSRVHFASGKSQQQIHSGQLPVVAGQLRARTVGETVNLHRLIARCAHIGEIGGDDAACCRVGELLLQFAPLSARPPDSTRIDGRLVAVFVADPASAADPAPEQVRLQFGLTAAEAVVACEIVKGLGIRDCARVIGISETTARTHLHRVFEKTGTKRQAQLVRKLLASRPVLRRP